MQLARERIYETVRRDILSCALMPGIELREAELAERYSVSKSPIRDAMQRLEFEGLVEIEPRRGHRVAPISVSDAQDILELRLVLETASIRKIAETASEHELADLDRFRAPDMSSVETFAAYNREFHHGLSLMSHNRRLAEETRRVMEFYDRLCVVSLSTLRAEGGFDGPLADHVAIIDFLQARNGTAAARIAKKHVTKSRGSIMRGLKSQAVVA